MVQRCDRRLKWSRQSDPFAAHLDITTQGAEKQSMHADTIHSSSEAIGSRRRRAASRLRRRETSPQCMLDVWLQNSFLFKTTIAPQTPIERISLGGREVTRCRYLSTRAIN